MIFPFIPGFYPPVPDYLCTVLFMKRIIAVFIAFMYLSTSTGATIHMHFCMGKVISWSLIEGKNSHCPKCGMVTGNSRNAGTVSAENCCHEETTQLRSGIDQKYSPAVPTGFRSLTILPDALAVTIGYPSCGNVRVNVPDHGDPASTGPHIFLLNRNFRR